MLKKLIIAIIVIVLLVLGYLLWNGTAKAPISNEPNVQNNQVQEIEESAGTVVASEKSHEIAYTNSGYLPKEITIKVGDTVIWKNQSSNGMWTASAMHPTHSVYSGTSMAEHCPDAQSSAFDACKSVQPGQSWSFKFNKSGTWRYHNHVKPTDFGSVIVK